ncbi:MAG: hypothetical protein QOC78_284 [Solirubrobacteraceae bacterium]|jgi:hypothetical protein|nr:hypothetical protein [Solirubrobacteraceae bacterium]
MRLTQIHPGDTVRVDDGLPYHAVVVTKERGRLGVRPLCRQLAPRTVKAAWIVDHWRHARSSSTRLDM